MFCEAYTRGIWGHEYTDDETDLRVKVFPPEHSVRWLCSPMSVGRFGYMRYLYHSPCE